jgi:hypothetical protein
VLSGIYGPKREEATQERRKLHNEELHNLFVSPYIRMIISRSKSLRRAGHTPLMTDEI